MASVNGHLSPGEISERIKASATAFPQSSLDTSPQPPACPNTNSGGQCICTNDGQTCGAGMANASVGVDQALRPIAAVSLPTASFNAGQSVALQGGGSAAADGGVINDYAWTNVGSLALAIANADQATASVTSPACGIGTVQLTVTDDAGRQDTANVVITPTRRPQPHRPTRTPTVPTAATPAVMVAVCPATATLQAGTAGQSFAAYVANSANAAVTWQVNGIAGGNSTVGTVSSSGAYTPPAAAKNSTLVSVTAVSAADTTISSVRAGHRHAVDHGEFRRWRWRGATDGFVSMLLGLLAAYTLVRRHTGGSVRGELNPLLSQHVHPAAHRVTTRGSRIRSGTNRTIAGSLNAARIRTTICSRWLTRSST